VPARPHRTGPRTAAIAERLRSPERLRTPCVQALKDAKVDISKIDEVVLVGGSTRMPRAQAIAKDIFGKVMSVPDATMWVYYRLLLELSADEIRDLQAQHPMEMKKQLATRLTDKFHGEGAGAKERAEFENVFSKGGVRSDMPEFAWAALAGGATEASIVDLLAATNLFPSKKEIRRLIEGGAVKIGDDKVSDPALKVAQPTGEIVIQAGKRTFVKVK
jgi:tyrosyl-tRNA synthetase